MVILKTWIFQIKTNKTCNRINQLTFTGSYLYYSFAWLACYLYIFMFNHPSDIFSVPVWYNSIHTMHIKYSIRSILNKISFTLQYATKSILFQCKNNNNQKKKRIKSMFGVCCIKLQLQKLKMQIIEWKLLLHFFFLFMFFYIVCF